MSDDQNRRWRELLRVINPDETHLVVPASLRPEVAEKACQSFLGHGVSHMLISKLDECPSGAGIVDLVQTLDLRARWITNGQSVPTDIAPAQFALPLALGMNDIPDPAELARRSLVRGANPQSDQDDSDGDVIRFSRVLERGTPQMVTGVRAGPGIAVPSGYRPFVESE